jgi:hypothetical protein
MLFLQNTGTLEGGKKIERGIGKRGEGERGRGRARGRERERAGEE